MTGMTVIFVEDPGAVNCIAPLAEKLAARRAPLRLLSSGPATALLRGRGLAPEPLAGPAEALLNDQTTLLLVGTSENLESPAFDLVAEARARGVPSAAIIDSGANSAHRFRGRSDAPFTHAPDRLLVPDEHARQSYVELGFDERHVYVVGHPNDDRVRAMAAELATVGRDRLRGETLRADVQGRRVVVFVSEISDGLDPGQYRRADDYRLCGRGDRELRSEIVVEELLDAVTALVEEGVSRPYLVLRRHPKETEAELAGLAEAFDEVSAGGSPHRLIFAADLVVGMTTMLLAEAELMGVPTLAILPREREREWLAPLRDGSIRSVFTRQALISQLREILTGPTEARLRPAATDGAVDRIISVLDEVAR